jgi:DNA polymerase III subunit delta'
MSFSLSKAIELMDLAAGKNRLSHAYLIIGPKGSGKEALARHMLGLGGHSVSPDGSLESLRSSTVTLISPESKTRRIVIDAIRSLEHSLHMAAPSGITKYAIIQDADRLQPQAANAFLKTLEEPPEACRLLLLTSRPEQILATILSRCLQVTLAGASGPPVLSPVVSPFLEKLRTDALSGKGGISASMTLMNEFSRALKAAKSAITKANEEALKAEAAYYKNKIEGDYLEQREKYYDALSASEYLAQRNEMIEVLLMWFGDALRVQQGGVQLDLPDFSEATGHLAQTKSTDWLCGRIEAVEKLRSHLTTNVFEALALEVAFLKMFS